MLFNLKHRAQKKNLLDNFAGAGGFVSWSPEYLIYRNRFDVNPPLDVEKKLASFIDGLVSAGIYAKLDEFWIYATNTSFNALLGVKNYKDCSVVGAPSFTVNRGYQGDTLNTKALNTNYIPSIDAINYTLNGASFGVYSRTSQAFSRVDMGVSDGVRQNALMSANTTLLNSRVAVNQAAIGVSFATFGDTLGLLALIRTTNANTRFFKSNVFVNQNNISTNLVTKSFYVLANNNNSVIASSSGKELCFAFIGGLLTDIEIQTIASSIEVYLDYIGAGVIP